MTAAIILAAGESGRLGQPKQNLLFNGQTLLERTVHAAQRSRCKPVIVVTGAHADKITPPFSSKVLYNENWREGMASSIRAGIEEISGNESISNVIILLCDQPFVSAELLDSMIGKQAETGKPIVACAYNGTTGVPVLFDRSIFAKLLSLQGDEGAKKILKAHAGEIAAINFEQGGIDIDTPGDYEKLNRLKIS